MKWTQLPPLSTLRAFAAFAEHGNLSAAGAALNVSHAAISQQLRALETHTAVALLDRSGRRLRLTPEGAELAQALLSGFETMERVLDGLTEREALRPLDISTTPSFASGWLMPRLARFRALHPDIHLRLDPTAELRPLEPGGTDIALRYGDGNWPGYDSSLIVASPIVVVAARSLVGDLAITDPADLTRYPWLQELGTNEATDWLAKRGLGPDKGVGLTALPGHLLLEAARQGQGVTSAARVFVESDIAAGRLRVLFQDPEVKGYHAVTRPGIPRPPLKAFLTWIRREAAKS